MATAFSSVRASTQAIAFDQEQGMILQRRPTALPATQAAMPQHLPSAPVHGSKLGRAGDRPAGAARYRRDGTCRVCLDGKFRIEWIAKALRMARRPASSTDPSSPQPAPTALAPRPARSFHRRIGTMGPQAGINVRLTRRSSQPRIPRPHASVDARRAKIRRQPDLSLAWRSLPRSGDYAPTASAGILFRELDRDFGDDLFH